MYASPGHCDFYNTTRPHSSLKAQTPDQVYFKRLPDPWQPKTKSKNFHLRKKQKLSKPGPPQDLSAIYKSIQAQRWPRASGLCEEIMVRLCCTAMREASTLEQESAKPEIA